MSKLELEIANQEEAKEMPPRFVAAISPMSRQATELWFVYDTHLQINVFHWYGRSAQTKANVVAQALNALGHMYE